MKFALLKYSTHNLGDEIQSIAARNFLPSVDLFLDRDAHSEVSGPVAMIHNGWWMHFNSPLNFPISDSVVPIFAGIHFGGEFRNNVTEKAIKYLRDHDPIPCRDHSTDCWLREIGVRAYFFGCLTMTLSEFSKESKTPRLGKFSVDVLGAPKGFEVLTHHHEDTSDPLARFRRAEELIEIYSRAELVVTSRLHCALVCLSFGTPFVLVADDGDPRFEAISKWCLLVNPSNFSWSSLNPSPGLRPSGHIADMVSAVRGMISQVKIQMNPVF